MHEIGPADFAGETLCYSLIVLTGCNMIDRSFGVASPAIHLSLLHRKHMIDLLIPTEMDQLLE